ncbi:nitric oxide reductase activation protein NorD [Mycobacterium sp. Marseille-P9652]|uniref:nitric oxide reductase activation protein NorD n=1 Tax=Mycobacterium sp. Marseille-P9652 TaxID=2654950 RepID=UPI00351A1687
MANDAQTPWSPGLSMFASALAGRPVAVAGHASPGPAWTDGHTIYVDACAPSRARLEAVAVQASMIGAGSLDAVVARAILHRPRLATRYLAVEGHRALVGNSDLLPATLASLGDPEIACRSGSPADSLDVARSRAAVGDPPPEFGGIRPAKLIASARAAEQEQRENQGHAPRRRGAPELDELDAAATDESDDPDLFTSPVGGGGFIGTWLKKMLSSARKTGSGGGPPGADTPTHRTDSATRGAHAVSSLAAVSNDAADGYRRSPGEDGLRYPEWDAARRRYRPAWCTVREVEPQISASATHAIEAAVGVRRPLARLGVGPHRCHRQSQGDDIDIDAAVEARVEVLARSVPDESVYLASLRRRRDLSVLLLLDVSGSAAEPGTAGRTVHEQQRAAVANLAVALHDLGDRVALYAYYSQGRGAVTMVPVKRFDDHLDSRVMKRLNSLEPGAYSRLGAAIRHGSAVVEARGGTSRRLLVVLSDGLAYDHGYERAYGAADARRALAEARRRGTGSVCLTIGAGTDVPSLRRVFGDTAHATIARPDQLAGVIGPLFRSALRSAEVRRRTVSVRVGATTRGESRTSTHVRGR